MNVEQIKAAYKRSLGEFEPVIIRRYTGAGANRPYFDATVQARVTKFEPVEIAGTIVQGDRKLIVLAQDLIDAQFALPVRKGDKVVVRGVELNIAAADDSTRRVGTVLIALEIQATG